MKRTYLEVTYRHGRALAAYLYLPREPADASCSTRRVDPGLLVDFNAVGAPIGIEITAPAQITVTILNRLLAELGQAPLGQDDLAPLAAA